MQKIRSVAAFVAALMALVGPGLAAAVPDEPRCSNDGYISDKLVPTARIAKEIYRAVARGMSPNVFKRYPIVTVSDEGDHWSVSQKNNDPPPKTPPGTIVVTMGGGQLYMDIDKCSGAISHAAFNR